MQNIQAPLPQGGFFDRNHDLHAVLQIPALPIRAPQVHQRIARIVETEDAAVFEEPAHHAAYPNIFAVPRQIRAQTIVAPHDKIDLHAGAGRLVQPANDARIVQRVHFGDNAPVALRLVAGDLLFHQFVERLAQVPRRHQQFFVMLLRRVARQEMEQINDVVADILAARKQPHIRVETGGRRVVVARADVAVGPQPLVLLANHQRRLGVRLEAHQAIGDMRARIFELAPPLHIVRLVEPGFDLDQHGHLLAALGRPNQRIHDRRFFGRTV